MFKFKKIHEKKTEIVIANIFRILLVVSIIISIINTNWLSLFIAIITFLLTFLPFIITQRNHIHLPPTFQIIILLFIFAAQYLGELKAYYYKFWWWDLMLHTLSGVILGFIGFLLVYILNKEEKVDVMLSPVFMALFAFTFAVSIGVVWEIFEFSMDSLFGFNMQKSGLVDTMWDLIVDSLGALVTSVYGYIYERNKDKSIFSRFLNGFIKTNSNLFRKKKNKEYIKSKDESEIPM
jgi:hypothetical protein